MREIIPGVIAMTMDEFIVVATDAVKAEGPTLADQMAADTEARYPGYAAWKAKVDEAVWKRAGCSIDDLPDVPLLDWFEDDMCPGSAAGYAIHYANGGELP